MCNHLINKNSFVKKPSILSIIFIVFILNASVYSNECIDSSDYNSMLAFEANQLSNIMHIFISFNERKFNQVNNYKDFKELEKEGDNYLKDSNIKIHINCIHSQNNNLRNSNNLVDLDDLAIQYKKEKEIQINIVTKNLIKKNNINESSLKGLLNYLNTLSDSIKNNSQFQSKKLYIFN